MIIEPAKIEWLADGRPRAQAFDDIYLTDHDADGGIQDALRFYLNPAKIREKAETQSLVTVAELGFGTGLNFACCAAQILHSGSTRLHYIGIEAHPLSTQQLKHLHGVKQPSSSLSPTHPADGNRVSSDSFNTTARQLYRALYDSGQSPPLLTGWHRRFLCGGKICLSIYHGDVEEGLAELVQRQSVAVDAWLLDGFAPEKNPAMWQAKILPTWPAAP